VVPDDPRGKRLLIVTTDLFVPYQHCAAVRVLGQTIGCTIDTIGFDRSRSPYEPPHRASELLQEIRSTILWLREIAVPPTRSSAFAPADRYFGGECCLTRASTHW